MAPRNRRNPAPITDVAEIERAITGWVNRHNQHDQLERKVKSARERCGATHAGRRQRIDDQIATIHDLHADGDYGAMAVATATLVTLVGEADRLVLGTGAAARKRTSTRAAEERDILVWLRDYLTEHPTPIVKVLASAYVAEASKAKGDEDSKILPPRKLRSVEALIKKHGLIQKGRPRS